MSRSSILWLLAAFTSTLAAQSPTAGTDAAAALRRSLTDAAEDSTPEAVRFAVGALYEDDPSLRRDALRFLRARPTAYTVNHLRRAFVRERDTGLFAEHLAGLLARPAESATVAALARWIGGRSGGLYDLARYHLGLGRAPDTAVVLVWPGPRDAAGRGLAPDRSVFPLRRVRGRRVRLRAPPSRGRGRLLLGYRWSGSAALAAALRSGDRELAALRLEPGSGALGLHRGLRAASVRIPDGAIALDADLELTLERDPGDGLELHGWVAFSDAAETAASPLHEIDLAPGAAGVSIRRGLAPDREWLPRLVTTAEEAELELTLEDHRGWSQLQIDHWTADPSSATWEVSLNGTPLIRLVSQPLPRPARSRHLVGLRRGVNRLRLRRKRGGPLHLECIRLVRAVASPR